MPQMPHALVVPPSLEMAQKAHKSPHGLTRLSPFYPDRLFLLQYRKVTNGRSTERISHTKKRPGRIACGKRDPPRPLKHPLPLVHTWIGAPNRAWQPPGKRSKPMATLYHANFCQFQPETPPTNPRLHLLNPAPLPPHHLGRLPTQTHRLALIPSLADPPPDTVLATPQTTPLSTLIHPPTNPPGTPLSIPSTLQNQPCPQTTAIPQHRQLLPLGNLLHPPPASDRQPPPAPTGCRHARPPRPRQRLAHPAHAAPHARPPDDHPAPSTDLCRRHARPPPPLHDVQALRHL